MKPETLVIVCTRAVGRPAVPGSLTGSCGACANDVFVAPSSWRTIEAEMGTRPIEIRCIPCAIHEAETSDESVRLREPTPDQVAELKRYGL